MPKGLDAAVAAHLFSALFRGFQCHSGHSSAAFKGCVGERRVNEMTLDMSFVHRSIGILSLCLDREFTRQSTITTSY
jgi:hypothetical protein